MTRSLLTRGASFALALTALAWPSIGLAYGYYYFTEWGTCGDAPGYFDLPSGIAVGPDGDVYVVDRNTDRVQKFTNGGQFIAEWHLPGPGATPFGVVIDGGIAYVTDGGTNQVFKYTTDGTLITQWGSPGNGDGEFDVAFGVTVGPDHSVYVSDLENHRVQKFTPDGAYVTQWGSGHSGDGTLSTPHGMVTDPAGNVYVTDMNAGRVNEYTSDGVFITTFGYGILGTPTGIVRDVDGNFYVSDQFFSQVQKFSPTGGALESFGSFGSDGGQMRYPTGVAVDANGKVFVADYQNCRVEVFAPCPFPAFTLEPQPLSLSYGATAVFSVTVPNALNYIWVHDNQNLSDGGRLSGTQTNTLTITDFQESDLGTYWCTAYNVCSQMNESDHVTLSLGTEPSCFGPAASPPNDMAAWWAMDAGPGNTVPDVLHPVGNKNHASLTGAAALVTGKVGTAVRCEALDDGLHVPSTLSPRLAASSTGLSIDAWILPRSGPDPGATRMILQKGLLEKATTTVGGSTALAPGYAFYLCNGGRLGFLMPDPDYVPVRFEPAMLPMSMDEWHHVAVTIQPLVTGGGKFYVDGAQVASFTPPSGILGNLADLYIGRFSPQLGPATTAYPFHGDIDEVEVFVSAIDAASVHALWQAGCTGKRRVQVLTNSLVSSREGTASADVCFAVQNLSSSDHSYQWTIATTGPSAECPSAVPVTFTAASGSVSVPAGQRIDLSTTASVSPGSLSTAFTRCYQLTVTDQGDGGVMTASGQLSYSGEHISGKAACSPPEIGAFFTPLGAAQAGSGVATFTLFNDGPDGVTVPLSLRTRDPGTGGPSAVLRLNGQSAGAPWSGSLFVPAAGSAQLPVNVSLDEFEPFLEDEIVLATDVDGDHVYTDVSSTHVAAGDDTSLAFVGVGPVARPPAGRLSLRASPNPFGAGTVLAFTLARASHVDIEVMDVSGRRVRRVLSGALDPGERRLTWDGHDDAGAQLPAGVYLGRIRAGGDVAMVRLMIVR